MCGFSVDSVFMYIVIIKKVHFSSSHPWWKGTFLMLACNSHIIYYLLHILLGSKWSVSHKEECSVKQFYIVPEDTTIKFSVNQVETGQKSIQKLCNYKIIVNLLIFELYGIIIEIQKCVKCT